MKNFASTNPYRPETGRMPLFLARRHQEVKALEGPAAVPRGGARGWGRRASGGPGSGGIGQAPFGSLTRL